MKPSRRVTLVLGAVVLATALPAYALNITGTNSNDTLRGTAQADKINGKGGNDRIFGLAGNDTLIGGPGKDYLDGGAGDDRLLTRDGVRDTAVCGPGRDTVIADSADVVRADCEVVLRPTPAPPPPPAGTDRTNPIPLGQPGDLGNGWTVTVTGVVPNATAQVLAANMFNDPPASGNQFFMISASATYKGAGSSKLDSGYGMRAVGASNVAYTTFTNSCGVLPEPNLELDDPQVFTGGTVSGNAACWEIRSSDAASLVMFFKPFLSDKVTWFALGGSPTTSPTAPVTVTPGTYAALVEGNSLTFNVVPERLITGFSLNYIRRDCDSGGWYVYGPLTIVTRFPIAADGTFRFTWDGRQGTVSGEPATHGGEFAGRFTSATTAVGTILATLEWDHQGTRLKCTSGSRPWTASLQP